MSQVMNNIILHGFKLPVIKPIKALFKSCIVSGPYVFVSGQIPIGFGDLKEYCGQLGKDISLEKGQEIAVLCGLNVIAQLNEVLEDLDRIKQCIKLTVFVNSAPDFTRQAEVANTVSDLILKAFGEKGQHARSAIGVSQLPFGVAVEVEAIFEIVL